MYSLIVFPYESDPRTRQISSVAGELWLSYFILAANVYDAFPKKAQNDLVSFDAETKLLEEQAQKRLFKAMDLAMRYYSRDSIWRQLIDPDAYHNLSIDDFLILSSRYNTTPLNDFDESLSDIWRLSLDWNQLLDFLVSAYRSLSREFNESNGIRHVILLNPEDEDLLLHFTSASHGERGIIAEAVSRETVKNKLDMNSNSRVSDPSCI